MASRILSPITSTWGVKFLAIICIYSIVGLCFYSYMLRRFPPNDSENWDFKPIDTFSPVEKVLKKNFERCLSKYFLSHDVVGNPALHTNSTENYSKSELEVPPIVTQFTGLLTLLLSTQIVLLEPSVLFCMLNSEYRDLLLKRNFPLKELRKHSRVLTFGISGSVVEEAENWKKVFRMHDYSIEFAKERHHKWTQSSNSLDNATHFISHVLLKKEDWIFHLVVLYERENFLWHDALRRPKKDDMFSKKVLHFTQHTSAYEKFNYVSLGFKNESLIDIHIPSHPHYLLLQMSSSKFLECNSTIVTKFAKIAHGPTPLHPGLTHSQFERRAAVALMELKSVLSPLLMNVWIWSGTLLGWYRECGVISYTSDVDFGAWAEDVDSLDNLTEHFLASKLLYKERMGLLENGLEFHLSFHTLRVDLFFLYLEENGTWYAGHKPSQGYYFKYHHPSFKLCSAEWLQQKVLVPCETEKILTTEYGVNWMEPISNWNYEHSIRNRGPNIYWPKSIVKEVYTDRTGPL